MATVAQAYRFALDPTPIQQRRLASHVGAARKAFNSMLAEVKATLRAREWERRLLGGCLTAQGWSLPALRRTWNDNKDRWAPWWRECSKEAFNTGLDSLARALANWSESKAGRRPGPKMGFPRFRKRGHGPQSVRFTTGAIRVEPDRHHVVLPRLGRIRTHESTRKLARRLEAGSARILSATVTRTGGRWFCSFTVECQRQVGQGAVPVHINLDRHHPVVGLDAGVTTLATVCAPDGAVVHTEANPKPLAAVQGRLRRLQRQAARQQKHSKRWRRTQRRVGRVHHRTANLRRDALAKLTTALAQRHQVVVVEELNLAGMGRRKPGAGRGGRGFNRALRDAALGEIRRQLTYKTHWYGSTLVVADRWYPSSKTCSGCGTRKPSLQLAERTYTCDACGLVIDRDRNAAVNLARLGEQSRPAGSGPAAGRGANHKTEPVPAGGDEASTPHGTTSAHKTGTAPSQEEAA